MLRKKYIKSSRDIRKIPYDLVSELVILRDYVDTSEAYLNEEHKLLVDLADGLYNNGWIDEIVSKMKSTYPEIFDKYGDDYFELILDDCSAIDSQIRPNNVQDLIDEYLAKAEEFSGSVDIESATDVKAGISVNELIQNYKSNNPEGHFFDKDTLKFFGERKSDMRVDKDIVTIKDFSGNDRQAYRFTSKQRNAPGGPRTSEHFFDKDTFEEIVTSKTIKASVGHNDPGRYFDLVDYYDVWADEDGGWQVNDVSIVERDIWISDDTTEEELFNYLKDTLGYFDRNTKFSDVEIIWDSLEFIEFFDASNGYPLCRLQESYKQ